MKQFEGESENASNDGPLTMWELFDWHRFGWGIMHDLDVPENYETHFLRYFYDE